jgi:NhaA family Na+:H+ antiporter
MATIDDHAERRMALAGGALLGLATLAALIVANTPLAPHVTTALAIPAQVSIGEFVVLKPLRLWINDGLMAVFFLLVGLEIKRELVEGQLSRRQDALLPLFGALGGFIAPALLFLAIIGPAHETARAWAVPTATDIAFVVAVCAMLGRAMPAQLRIFLLGLAVIDDLMAVIVIAVFYTETISLTSLMIAGGAALGVVIMAALGVKRVAAYILLGLVMWAAVLKSGVHATIAGVALGMLIPIKARPGEESPLHRLEHGLKPWVALMIMPIFAFANAGVPLLGLNWSDLLAPLPLAIACGLFFGKQIGVSFAVWAADRTGLAPRPAGVSWGQVYGAALLTGIGFTMSLFIGSLAVPADQMDGVRFGVLAGSLASALAGVAVLLAMRPRA